VTTRTYTELYDLIKALAGVSDFTTGEQTNILAFVNRRLYQGYRASETWPRYVKGAEARPATNGVIATTFTPSSQNISSATRDGTTVTIVLPLACDFAAGMYVTVASLSGTEDPNGSKQVTAISTTTVTNDTFTYTLSSGTGTETYTGSGTAIADAVDDIDSFTRVWGGNPLNLNSVQEYEFYVESDGAHVYGNYKELSGFWVGYIKQWGGPFTTSSTDIPQELYEYTAHAAYADFLRMDGQVDKAESEELVAQQYLIVELDKSESQRNTNALQRRISTYVNRSNR
jgi:hypothetical protein